MFDHLSAASGTTVVADLASSAHTESQKPAQALQLQLAAGVAAADMVVAAGAEKLDQGQLVMVAATIRDAHYPVEKVAINLEVLQKNTGGEEEEQGKPEGNFKGDQGGAATQQSGGGESSKGGHGRAEQPRQAAMLVVATWAKAESRMPSWLPWLATRA